MRTWSKKQISYIVNMLKVSISQGIQPSHMSYQMLMCLYWIYIIFTFHWKCHIPLHQVTSILILFSVCTTRSHRFTSSRLYKNIFFIIKGEVSLNLILEFISIMMSMELLQNLWMVHSKPDSKVSLISPFQDTHHFYDIVGSHIRVWSLILG